MAQAKLKRRTETSARNATARRSRNQAASKSGDWSHPVVLGLALFFLTLLIYIPAMGAGFIWDDDQEITANVLLKSFGGLCKIWNIFTTPTADYFPLKTTMLWIEYQIQVLFGGTGLAPQPYHVVNILMHAIDVVLIWRLLLALEIPAAWFASLIFAIHPVNVESVAWIAERKNTLSMFFFVLSLLAYLRFEKGQQWKWYGWALAAFLASLLCKTSVVILPFVLLLMTWWRTTKLTQRDILQTVPFFALSVALGIITVYFQNGRAIGQEVIPIGGPTARLWEAGAAVWFYLGKALLPYNVMEIYPRWDFVHPTLMGFSLNPLLPDVPTNPVTFSRIIDTVIIFVPALMVGVVLFVFWWNRKGWGRAPFVAFAYFVICLAPAIGFLRMSYMRLTLVADHFTYLGILGIIALVVGSAGYYYRQSDASVRQVYNICAGAVAMVLMWRSAERAAVHRSEKTLWYDTLNRNPDTWQGHNHYGAALFMEQRVDEAMEHFQAAVRLKPENPEVHNNLALALATKGRMDEAIPQYYEAARIKGDDAAIRSNLANALETAKRYDEAIEQYHYAIQYNANDPATHCNLGFALYQTGQLDEAIKEFQKSLDIDPNFQLARQNLNLANQKRAERDIFLKK